MKLIVTTLLLMLSMQGMAFDLSSTWNNEFKKILNFTCSDNDGHLCANLCDNYSRCEIEEGYCRNCAGDNLFLKYIFNELGNNIQNSGELVDTDNFFEFIQKGNFVTLTSKSIFNFVDKFNSFKLKNAFRSLCSMPTEYPIVFLEVNEVSRVPEKVKYISCSSTPNNVSIYHLQMVYNVEIN